MADIIKDDFIKRSDALLAAFDLYERDCSALLNNGIPYQHIKNALRTIKAIDVQPVVHGEWKLSTTYEPCDTWVCSNCGIELGLYAVDMHGINYFRRFCPRCGADMRGDTTDG